MQDPSLLHVAAIPTIGILSQWVAIRFKFPAILLLLMSGFLVGPVLKWLNPDALMGDMIYPFISLSVAIILFEGGLTLRFAELKGTGKAVGKLIFLGGLISWAVISLLSGVFFGFDFRLAILLGAILLVSGPTVVTPLLRQIKVKQSLSSILRWEGIIIDPLGASLAVLIFEMIVAQKAADAIGAGLVVILSTLLAGIVIGALAALLIIIVIKKHVIPDYLQEAFTFILVISAYACSDMVQSESGLLAVTIMGIILANQELVTIRHIISFKENITVLLISSLFIILAARIELNSLMAILNLKTLGFLACLIFLVRPLTVFLSTAQSSLKFKEKLFLSALYPRGIVAAAVASLFSIRLSEAGFMHAELLNPLTFITIIATVSFYGLLGRPLVNLLNQRQEQHGIILVGAQRWACLFAKSLKLAKVPVLLIDTNIENIIAAKEMGLNTQHGSILSQKVKDDIELSSYGSILSITSSDETNLLASIEYNTLFSDLNIFRLYPKDRKKDLFVTTSQGKFLFGKGITASYIESTLLAGASFKPSTLTEAFTFDDFKQRYPKAIIFCVITEKGRLKFFFDGHRYTPDSGSILIALRK